jgi:hypothetical protein
MSNETEALSALQENIKLKGSNAYYYAHGSTPNGPTWDGKEEPRLLHVDSSAASKVSVKNHVQPIQEYAWTDSQKSVKIFIDHDAADTIDQANITLVGQLEHNYL